MAFASFTGDLSQSLIIAGMNAPAQGMQKYVFAAPQAVKASISVVFRRCYGLELGSKRAPAISPRAGFSTAVDRAKQYWPMSPMTHREQSSQF